MKQDSFEQLSDKDKLFFLIKNGSEIENDSVDDFKNLFEKIGENCFNFVNENKETLLISACKEGRSYIAQILLNDPRLMPNPNDNFITNNRESYITRKDKKVKDESGEGGKSAIFYAYKNALFEIIPVIIQYYDLHDIDKEILTKDSDLYKNLGTYIQNEKCGVKQEENSHFEEVIIKGIKRINPNIESKNITKEMRKNAIEMMHNSLQDSDNRLSLPTPDSTTVLATSLLSPFQSSKSGKTANISGPAENKIESDAPRTSPQIGCFSSLMSCFSRAFRRNAPVYNELNGRNGRE